MADTTNKQYMLTTLDNPYNPFTQYDEWYALDEARGYHSTGLLARYVVTSDALSPADQENAIQQGLNELIQDNPYGMYKKVSTDDFVGQNT
jgi:hypothetical protein